VLLTRSPADGATGVPLTTAVTATFTEALDARTVTTSTFQLAGPAAPAEDGGASGSTVAVPGSVSFSGTTATYTPLAPLAASTLYTVTITAGLKDVAGNALAQGYQWAFTTGLPPDTTRPTVAATVPENGAAGVATNGTVSVTFSEPMNPATVNSASFTVKANGTTPVVGTIAFAGTTAVFTPAAGLLPNTPYTAGVASDVRDVAGNSMATAHSWTFTTGAAADTQPPTVLSTEPPNGGRLGAVFNPIRVTFSESMLASSLNATTFLVSTGSTTVAGNVTYAEASTTATFFPSGELAYDTTYRGTLTSGVKDAAGNPLAANYTWTFTTGPRPDTEWPYVALRNPDIGAVGVPVSTAITVTFSENMSPTTVNAASFTLAKNATRIAGSVSVAGKTAVLSPISVLEPGTTYTATVTSDVRDLAGNPMAANNSWTFTTGPLTDGTPPAVVSTEPFAAATDVPVSAIVRVNFNKAMDPATINAATFTLADANDVLIGGIISYAAASAVLTPTAPLAYSTSYTATLSEDVKDVVGNALSTFSFSFTTVSAPDTLPPIVVATTPPNGGTDVAVGAGVTATFSEPMKASSITSATFTLAGGSGGVTGVVTYNAMTNTATFQSASNLSYNTAYSASISSAAQDVAGNRLTANHAWSFTTARSPDTTPPTVVAQNPAPNATNVPVNAVVLVTFSENMDVLTLSPLSFRLSDGASQIAALVDAVGKTALLTPVSPLAYSKTHVVTLTTDVQDLAGNGLTQDLTWLFTTAPPPDTVKPTVRTTNPSAGATDVAKNVAVEVIFSEEIQPSTVNTATFTMRTGSFPLVSGTIAATGNTAVFTPTAALLGNSTYTVTLGAAIADLAGNTLGQNFTFTFTTVP
jgi:hypothetical protein